MGSDVQTLITEHIDLWTSAIEHKKSAGRGSSKKHNLYGIKKLRDLILELAVRGKLVPQDPSDEPASVLLERIAEERTQLVKEKKIKKSKKLAEIFEEESPFIIPQGWEWVRLGSIGNIFNGNSVSARIKAEKYTDIEGLPFIATKDVGYGFEILDYQNGISIPVDEPKFKVAHENSVLMCAEGGSAGKKCGITNRNICFGNKLFANELYAGINPAFILSCYLTPTFYNQFSESMTGIIGGISAGKFVELLVPLPSIKEQNRIVSKVNELMVLCDQLEEQTERSIEAHQVLVETLLGTLTQSQNADELAENWQRLAEHFDTLFTTEHSIDQLKQTILQLAVMGKLVPQEPNDEPASVLLERIGAEKEQLIKDKKIQRSKSLPLVDSEEKNHDIPVAWQWVRFSDVASCRLGKMLDKAKNKGELLPYLRNTNVQWSFCNLDDVKQMRFEESEKEEFLIKVGDLLICEGGEPGRCAIWNKPDNEIYFQKALHRARPFQGVLAEYLQICLRKDAFSKQLDKYFTGATIKHFPGDKLARYVVPIPPEKEQIRLVAKVNQLLTICDQLKARLQESQQTQLSLAKAITDQALQG
ncbi:restriction endonuclease subunit S [Neptuniibacter sp. QD72_48]|uniref:restriction endonuclease subunit S n=1 Tax=Neptuniibacter sp. QD72_48 TaxID=3398214 RepID=UPI0039F58C77